MDVKEYISSGILDSYVLGTSSDTEMKEVECLSMVYPEIKAELNKLESIFEKFATATAVEPPPELRSKILSAIDQVKQISADSPASSEPKPGAELKPTISPFWKVAAAASIALLVVLGGLWIYSYQKQNYIKESLVAAGKENTRLRKQLGQLEEDRKANEHINYILAHQATKRINLGGTKLSPASTASVYWNTETSEVLLKVNQLPSPAPGSQYQLWAIVDSKPLDMGVFEFDNALKSIRKMPYLVRNAAAFAITLEKKGGNPTPTLSAMYVIGNI